tara:strand:+ start:279 stop:527 length:249 start_codon:yes stop_codon:yes gene_type:complete
MSFIIKGDTVTFKNNYIPQDITLKHSDNNFKLRFGSDVQFFANATHQKIFLKDFEITLSDNDDNILEIKKAGKTLWSLQEDN